MNRIKKELMRKGVKLEHQYECLPYNGIQAVKVYSESASVAVFHTGIALRWTLTRTGELIDTTPEEWN